MKKLYFAILIILSFISLNAATSVVTNSGTTFTPANITITVGDDVQFNIGGTHNVVEVSQATWLANGNTPLAGGFSTPFGGGNVNSFTTAGIHYYVCSPHAALAMKGIINVVLFQDNFEGASQWTLNTNTLGSGTANDNQWLINNDYTISAGFPPYIPATFLATQPANIIPANQNYMHINYFGAGGALGTGPLYGGTGAGATYFAEMTNDISTASHTGVSFSFYYVDNGGSGRVYFSTDMGASWIQANATNYNNQTTWVQETITNAAFDNQATLRFAFMFVDDGTVVDPPYAIDDVQITGTAAVPPAGPTTWTGAVNTNWTNAGNWTSGVPTACSQDVIIPMGLGNYPALVGQTVGAKDITMGLGASITIDLASTLQVCGNIIGAANISGMGALIIDGTADQTMTGIITVGSVMLNKSGAGNLFEVLGSSVLSVTGQLDMKAGELKATAGNVVIASTALGTAYINDFDPLYTGTFFAGSNVAVQRYFSNPGTAFHYITAPVIGFNIAGFSLPATAPDGTQVTANATCDGLDPSSAYGQMFDYREDQVGTCVLDGWHVRTTGVVNVGQGFAAIINNATTLYAQGDPTTGNQMATVTYNAGNGDGWNLIGNPYPSAIDWALVAASNPQIVNGTAHLYQSSGYYDGTYLPANLITAGNIAHGQAFFVQVNAATNISFTDAMRTTGDPGFKSEEDNFEYLVSLKVDGANGSDKTIIAFDENFTINNDFLYDANKLKSLEDKPTFYTNSWNTKQAINAIPSLSDEVVVIPVGLKHNIDGQFTISIEEMLNVPERVLMFLEDKETGAFINLRETDTYTFNMTATSSQERFNIHFVPAYEIVVENETCQGNDGSITFTPNNYMINGTQIVWNKEITKVGSSEIITDYSSLSKGWYSINTNYGNYSLQELYEIQSAEQVVANFESSSNELYIGELLQLTNLSEGNASYSWSFGDGSVINNVINPTYSYANAGQYEVVLESSTKDCNDSKTITVNVSNKTTTIKDFNSLQNVNIYTNNKVLFVDLQSLSTNELTEIKVYNLIGNNIASKIIETNKKTSLNLSNMATGYYLVNIKRASKTSTFKVLIK